MTLQQIPKIIHQSYVSTKVPQKIADNIKKIKTLNKDWQHRMYTNEDMSAFIAKYYSEEILYCFQRINPNYGAARADFFRYLLIYKVGGLWLDIKSTTDAPLSENLYEDDYFLLSQWRNKMGEKFQGWGLFPELNHVPGGEFQQWFILSAPRNPAIERVILNVVNQIKNYSIHIHGVGHKGVLRTTGPIVFTLSILPHLKSNLYRFTDIETDLKIKYSVYSKSDHRKLFKQHYSELSEPIIL